MYHDFFGLSELPFELTPNPKYLFLTKQHREALSTLEYGLFDAKGVTALVGEAGTGKTTLLRAALESERCRNVSCVHLMNPTLTRTEFVEILSSRFGLSARASRIEGRRCCRSSMRFFAIGGRADRLRHSSSMRRRV